MTLYFCVEHTGGIRTWHKTEYKVFNRKTLKEFGRMIDQSNRDNPGMNFKPALESCIKRLNPNIQWVFYSENEFFRYYVGR